MKSQESACEDLLEMTQLSKFPPVLMINWLVLGGKKKRCGILKPIILHLCQI